MKTTSILATGNAAIEIAETDSSVSLHKYSDPTEGAREDISIADARAIAREDAGLIYATRRNAAATLGSIGGSVKSPAKSAAARENGRKGGRPSAFSRFLRAFGEASGQSDADAHWAAYSRSLTDAEREQVERGGYEAGLREGAAYRSL